MTPYKAEKARLRREMIDRRKNQYAKPDHPSVPLQGIYPSWYARRYFGNVFEQAQAVMKRRKPLPGVL